MTKHRMFGAPNLRQSKKFLSLYTTSGCDGRDIQNVCLAPHSTLGPEYSTLHFTRTQGLGLRETVRHQMCSIFIGSSANGRSHVESSEFDVCIVPEQLSSVIHATTGEIIVNTLQQLCRENLAEYTLLCTLGRSNFAKSIVDCAKYSVECRHLRLKKVECIVCRAECRFFSKVAPCSLQTVDCSMQPAVCSLQPVL